MIPTGHPKQKFIIIGHTSGNECGIVYANNFFILSNITRPSLTAQTIDEKLSSIRIISEACLATSLPLNLNIYFVNSIKNKFLPDPIAIPISARFNAGASFTPSPVIAIKRWRF